MADKEYIERGALLKTCKRQIECEWNTLASPGTWANAFEDFSDLVEQTPAADVVAVRHGEWIDKPTGAYGRMQSWCSACGKHSGIGGIESNRHKPYCPNCGAKIGGERKEQT